MPAKGYRSMDEDLVPVAVRLPQSIFPDIDAHVKRLRKEHRYLPIGRSDAIRDLIIFACDAKRESKAEVTDTVTDTTLELAVDVTQESTVPVPTAGGQTG